MWRQGDILIEAIDAIPSDARELDHMILAEGAATGHRHAVERARGIRHYVHGETQYLDVACASATIGHPEHRPIVLATGKYRVWRQREYTGAAPRTVID